MPFGTRLDHWLQLIRGEFQEVPDLRVTLEQAEVVWSLEPRDLELILETFVDVGFLRRVSDGAYFHPHLRGVAGLRPQRALRKPRLLGRTRPNRLIRHHSSEKRSV